MSLFSHAVFVTSVARLDALPALGAVEIAFAGRSNAGKSSAINTLVGHNRLAYVSKTPGRTRLINFFRLPGGAVLVDLPGYGYAAVSEPTQRQWQHLLEGYLRRRDSLAGLVLIMDARHPLMPLDRQMLDWYAPCGRPIHVLLTKSDKLSRGPAKQLLERTRRELAAWGSKVTAQLFSSLKKSGIDEAELTIGSWLSDCAQVDLRGGTEPGNDDEKEEPPVKGEKTGG